MRGLKERHPSCSEERFLDHLQVALDHRDSGECALLVRRNVAVVNFDVT